MATKAKLQGLNAVRIIRETTAGTKDALLTRFVTYALQALDPKTKTRSELLQDAAALAPPRKAPEEKMPPPAAAAEPQTTPKKLGGGEAAKAHGEEPDRIGALQEPEKDAREATHSIEMGQPAEPVELSEPAAAKPAAEATTAAQPAAEAAKPPA